MVRFVIEQPELRAARGLLPRQVMTYCVRVEDSSGVDYYAGRGHHHTVLKSGVRKRYSDFDALRSTLLARYGREGLLVPPLPPKSSATQTAEFVKRRMSGLALFLEGLASSPFLSMDASVERFMTTTSEGSDGTMGGGGGGGSMDLDEAGLGGLGLDGSAGDSSSGQAGGNRGYQLWQDHLAAGLGNPPSSSADDARVGQVRSELEAAERGLKEVLGASKGLGHGFAHFASALQGFSQALHVAADAERTVVALNDTGTEEGKEKEGEEGQGPAPVPELVAATAALYATVSPGYAAAPDQLGQLFAEGLEYELGALQALKGLLQGREELAAGLLKLQRKAQGLRGSASSSSSSSSNASPELAALEGSLAAEELKLHRYTTALLSVSVPEGARARARTLRRAFGHLAAVTTAAAGVTFNASLGYLEGAQMTPGAVVAAANDAAAALVLPPVPAIALPAGSAAAIGGNGKGGKARQQQQQQQQQQQPPSATSAEAAALASTTNALAGPKVAKPGSFLAEPAPNPPSSSSSSSSAAGAAAAASEGAAGAPVLSSVVLTLPSATERAAPPPAAPAGGGGDATSGPQGKGAKGKGKANGKKKAKATWESDDEADDPFSPGTRGGGNSTA